MRPDRSVRLVQLQLGAFSNEAFSPKIARDCGNLHILQIGPKSSKWTVSIQHGRNIGPTWGQLRPARPQLQAQLGPIRLQLPATCTHLGATSAQVEVHMASKLGDIAGPIRNPQSAQFSRVFSTFFAIDDASFEAMFPLCLRLAQLGVKLSPKVPSCGMLEPTWTSMCIVSGLQLQPIHLTSCAQDSPTWAKLGPSCAPLGAALHQVGSNPSQFCRLNATRFPLFPTFFGLWWGFVRGHVAHIGLVSGPTSVPDAPRQDQVAHAKSPKGAQVCTMLDRKLGSKLEPTGPSSAQVTPKLGPSGLLFGPT